MKKLDENTQIWLKKYAGLLNEDDDYGFMDHEAEMRKQQKQDELDEIRRRKAARDTQGDLSGLTPDQAVGRLVSLGGVYQQLAAKLEDGNIEHEDVELWLDQHENSISDPTETRKLQLARKLIDVYFLETVHEGQINEGFNYRRFVTAFRNGGAVSLPPESDKVQRSEVEYALQQGEICLGDDCVQFEQNEIFRNSEGKIVYVPRSKHDY